MEMIQKLIPHQYNIRHTTQKYKTIRRSFHAAAPASGMQQEKRLWGNFAKITE